MRTMNSYDLPLQAMPILKYIDGEMKSFCRHYVGGCLAHVIMAQLIIVMRIDCVPLDPLGDVELDEGSCGTFGGQP